VLILYQMREGEGSLGGADGREVLKDEEGWRKENG
jgi:hypothetical protein